VVEVSRTAANIKIRTQSETFRRMVLLQTSLFTLLGAVAFIVPVFSTGMTPGSITKAVTALVFIVGALFRPGAVDSPLSRRRTLRPTGSAQLETKLLEITSLSDDMTAEPAKSFSKIEMRDVEFHYPGKSADTAFKVGPFNFTLNSGDLVILTGGNGSGKSTFMKILAGFYRPASGELLLDGDAGASASDTNITAASSPRSFPTSICSSGFTASAIRTRRTHADAHEFKLQAKDTSHHGEFQTTDCRAASAGGSPDRGAARESGRC
jgi:putative ATP-binding cassette transporter